MARVIKIDDKQEKEVTHKDCGAVIGYFQNEVQFKRHYDYTGDYDVYNYITCPHCGKKVWVR